jgi:hypothetical protein
MPMKLLKVEQGHQLISKMTTEKRDHRPIGIRIILDQRRGQITVNKTVDPITSPSRTIHKSQITTQIVSRNQIINPTNRQGQITTRRVDRPSQITIQMGRVINQTDQLDQITNRPIKTNRRGQITNRRGQITIDQKSQKDRDQQINLDIDQIKQLDRKNLEK